MTTPSLLHAHGCVGVSRRAFHQLRDAIEAAAPGQSPAVLQQAGFAGGAELAFAFEDWTSTRYGAAPPDLDVAYLGEALSGFLTETGWGAVTMEPLGPGVLALDSTNWAESERIDPPAPWPSCHFSAGLLSELVSRASGAQVAVLQVECVSSGQERCRFLLGAPETLAAIYDRVVAGQPYLETVGGAA
ncbi:MAG: V4R domain-containing protein [Gemmatimonadota bacterium]